LERSGWTDKTYNSCKFHSGSTIFFHPLSSIGLQSFNHLQNGKFAVVGTYDGRCIFYSTDQLSYYTMIHVRSARGKNKEGRKVTGIEPMPGEDKVPFQNTKFIRTERKKSFFLSRSLLHRMIAGYAFTTSETYPCHANSKDIRIVVVK